MSIAVVSNVPTINAAKLRRARRLLAQGCTLRRAAQAIDVAPWRLDLALWNALGQSEEQR